MLWSYEMVTNKRLTVKIWFAVIWSRFVPATGYQPTLE